jgi:hypothetical protein
MVNGSVPDVRVGEQDELHSTASRGITHPWLILQHPFVHGKWFVPDVSVGEEDELHSTDSRGITHPWVIL